MGQYFRKLVGEKVYLSPIDPDDAPTYCRWFADPEVTRFLMGASWILGTGNERDTLVKMVNGQNDLAIVDGATDRLIGGCGFMGVDSVNRHAEVGIFIGDKDFWGKGFGTEALSLLCDFGFNVRNFHNLMLRVKAFNARAIRSYEKVGFRTMGTRRQANLNGEVYTDEIYMDLLAGEFPGRLDRELTR